MKTRDIIRNAINSAIENEFSFIESCSDRYTNKPLPDWEEAVNDRITFVEEMRKYYKRRFNTEPDMYIKLFTPHK